MTDSVIPSDSNLVRALDSVGRQSRRGKLNAPSEKVPATEEQDRSEDAAAPLQDTRKLPAIADRPEHAVRNGVVTDDPAACRSATNLSADLTVSV
jgi:hypothetical protein